ncbi:MAG: outer membrane protein assembly factor BamE [Pseudomonadota bacterium]
MKKIIILLITLLALPGCSYFHIHKMDVEQGNVITQDMLNKVHTGMTPWEVKNIMGNPVLANVFDPNRLDYVYTFKPGYGVGTETYITYIFRNGHLAETQGNMGSEFIK